MDRTALTRTPAAQEFPHVHMRGATLAVDADKDDERVISFVASDETVDRYGDIVSADGWQLANFKANPVFLWAHSYLDPIGTVEKIAVEGKRLMARVRFAAAGTSETVDGLWKLVQQRVLRAVSVGFAVGSEADIEYIRDRDGNVTGLRYLRPELLELSLVAVPANPNALAVARSMNLSPLLIARALPLDASIPKRNAENVARVRALHIAGMRLTAPRLAS
jgi:HK97 family phage prohead protease